MEYTVKFKLQIFILFTAFSRCPFPEWLIEVLCKQHTHVNMKKISFSEGFC